MSNMAERRPNLLIIGAQKAGSTWIYDVLRPHPEVFLPERVELCFFNRLDCEEPAQVSDYLRHFRAADPSVKWLGEKTPGYFWTTDRRRSAIQPPKGHNPNLPASVARVLGRDISLIVSLRHPVRRAISAYVHHGVRDRIKPKEHLKDVATRFGILDIGFYSQHLDVWEQEFGSERLLSLIFENDIARDPMVAYEMMCQFLEIDASFVPSSLGEVSNQNPARRIDGDVIDTGVAALNPVRPSDVRFLLDAYWPDIEALRRRFGVRLDVWDEDTATLEDFAGRDDPAPRPATPPTPAPRQRPTRKPTEGSGTTTVPVGEASHEVLRELGLDLTAQAAKQLGAGCSFEPPTRISNTGFHASGLGAFSYTTDGHVYATRIGRYCSIARAINIGQTDHPMDWLSTSPVQFRSAFKFATGAKFEHKAEYDADAPLPELERKAHLATRRVTTVGNDVWIGHGAIVIGGVDVGDGAVIAAGAVVTRDVEPYSVVAGVPARVMRRRFPDDIVERLLASAWWEYAPWQMRHIDFSDIGASLDAVEEMRRSGVEPYAPHLIEIVR